MEVHAGGGVAEGDLDGVAELERRPAVEVDQTVLLGEQANRRFRVVDEMRPAEVGRHGLPPAIEHDGRALPADDASADRQSELELSRHEPLVEAVHQDVRARLHLVDPRIRARHRVGAGSAARHDRALMPCGGESVDDLEQGFVCLSRAGLTRRPVVLGHAVALVALHTAHHEAG